MKVYIRDILRSAQGDMRRELPATETRVSEYVNETRPRDSVCCTEYVVWRCSIERLHKGPEEIGTAKDTYIPGSRGALATARKKNWNCYTPIACRLIMHREA